MKTSKQVRKRAVALEVLVLKWDKCTETLRNKLLFNDTTVLWIPIWLKLEKKSAGDGDEQTLRDVKTRNLAYVALQIHICSLRVRQCQELLEPTFNKLLLEGCREQQGNEQ